MKQWGFPGVLALIVTVLLYCFWVYLNTEMEWTTMSLELLASSQLPSLFSPLSLAYIRTLFALIVWGSIIYIVTDSNGLEITILLTDGKKRTMLFKGFSRLTMLLVMPFFMQWAIGGFAASSGVAIWAILAPVGALMILGTRQSSPWFLLFIRTN